MKKNTSILFTFLLYFFGIQFIYSQSKIELREFTAPATAVKGILNNGDAVLYNYFYKYDTKELTPREAPVNRYFGMNNKGDLFGIGILNGVLQPIYKLAGTTEWSGTGLFSNYTGTSFQPYKISNNGRYVSGQMNSQAFIYDTTEKKITNLTPLENQYGAAYGVNNEGVAVGWLDKNTGSAFRELAIMQIEKELEIILSDYAEPVNNHITSIDDNGLAVGDVGGNPFYYDTKTKEFKIFQLPAGFNTGTFLNHSKGIFVGYTQNSPNDRDAIIYHKSMGDKPKLLKDLLEEQGVIINNFTKKLFQAEVISENGDFIGGNFGNPGWIIKLNGYFDEKECKINVPDDFEVQMAFGETSVKVNYPTITSTCPTNTLVRTSGYESGSDFPPGETRISYDLLNANNEIVTSASFKVTVKDAYCSPRFLTIVQPITYVKFGSIENTTSAVASASEIENEYFLDKSTDVEAGKEYSITVAGNTNGSDTDRIVAYFDFNQDGIFDSNIEGFFVGDITNSTGTDGKTVTMSIQIPKDAKEGKTRMRVYKVYRLLAENPCGTNYAFGQAENYSVNIIKSLETSDQVENRDIIISPNPVKNILNIYSKNAVQSVEIFDLKGRKILKKQSTQNTLNLDFLEKGIYIVRVVTTEGEIITQKFIKE